MKMRVVLALIVIAFVVVAQGSEGLVISPSPAFPPAVHHEGEAPSPIHHGLTWRSSASSPSEQDGFVISPSPATLPMDPSTSEAPGLFQPNGSFLNPPVMLPPPTSAPTPQKIKGIEPSVSPSHSPSPSTKTFLPPFKAAPTPSSTERNVPPSIQPSPPQMKKVPTIRPPVSSTTAPAPVAIPIGNLPKSSPVSQPIKHASFPAPVASPSTNMPIISPVSHQNVNGSLPPSAHREGTNRSHTVEPISPAPVFILPKYSPVSQPTEPGSLPPTVHRKNSTIGHTIEPVSQAPVATPHANLPIKSPVSQPTHHGSFPPDVHNRTANKSHPHILEPPIPPPVASPSTNMPIISPVSHQNVNGSLPPSAHREGTNRSHTVEPISPAPVFILPKYSPVSQPTEPGSLPPTVHRKNSTIGHTIEPVSQAPVATPHANLPIKSPVSQPTHHGSFPPDVHNRTANKSHPHILEPPIPPPVASPSTNMPIISPVSHQNVNGSLPPSAHREGTNRSHTVEPISPAPVFILPKYSPVSQPTEPGSLPPTVHRKNSTIGHTIEPVSQAPVATPHANLPIKSPVSQPTHHGSFPPDVHNRTANKSHPHILEPPIPPLVSSPTSPFPVDSPLAHPSIPAASPSKLPAPVISPLSSTPPRRFNGGGEPVSAPFYKTPKPLPAIVHSPARAPVTSSSLTPTGSVNGKNSGEPASAPLYKAPKLPPVIVHSPAQAPAEHKARPFRHAPAISSPKSPSTKEDNSPASSPSSTFYKHHHTRNTITSHAPASSYFVSPPTSKHQDQPIPPSLLPTSGRRHHTSPPMNIGSADSPFAFPIQSPVSHVSPSPSPAPSPSFEVSPHSTKIPFHPPKVSASRPSSTNLKKPVLPRIQALPPPPPNEDCLSTICSEPYTNSPPGVPCKCVWPMKVGLRLSVPLYTFFPLVSELASEIATGVFMMQSQVRIMGANAASEQPDKTDAIIDLVPLGEEFDYTTAFLTSERFWHKQVVIKASYFGDYEVLYVSYPSLPPSPPLPPSINIIDGGPYSSNGNNGRTIKPLGVDIPKRQHKSGLSKGAITVIALSAFLAVVLCSAAVLALFKFRGHAGQPTSTPRGLPPPLTKEPGTGGPLVGGAHASASSSSFRSSIAAYAGSAKTFTMNEIEKATDNFDPSRIIGEGGFGLVYSGDLEDGTKVAMKVLKREDQHGDREFLSEVEMLSRLHHRNLVKLIGICAEVNFRCLVYELVPNGSVESHLHGVDRENSPLGWSARIKIALGAARGLAYLHEDSSPHVIHRDFKSSNILLEEDFTPKVSDFGLARTAADEDNRHISTRVMGTFGYVAPEYAMTGHLLVKSDVYSYGVVLLELLTGRKPVDMSQPPGQENLVAWARPLLTSRQGLEAIVDPSLGTDVPFDSIAKVAAIASMCVQPEVSDRPFMGEVVQALKLVCNECDEAKEAVSRSSSHDNLSVDLNTVSEQPPDNFQRHFSSANYDSGVDIENGLSASELFSSSARFGRQQATGSFRRHSYSGPLRTGRSRRLWQIIRNLSGGSVSEHGTMFKL